MQNLRSQNFVRGPHRAKNPYILGPNRTKQMFKGLSNVFQLQTVNHLRAMRAVQNLRSQNFVHGPHWAKKLDLTGQKNWTRSTHLNLNLDQPPSKLTANFANRTTICFIKHVGRTIGFVSSTNKKLGQTRYAVGGVRWGRGRPTAYVL